MDGERTFENELRKVLQHLYDPTFLRKSALVRLFGLHERTNPAGALRGTLEKAIEALRPAAGSPPGSRSRRYYEILFYRYVQQFTQRDVANQLGIGPRHVRREQTEAIRELAEQLYASFGLPEHLDSALFRDGLADGAESSALAMDREMLWLGDSLADQVAEVQPVVKESERLVIALACRHNVVLDLCLADDLPLVALAQTVLKQITLNLLTTAIHAVPGGRVSLISRLDDGQVMMRVTATANPQGKWQQPEREGLDMARRLIELFGGQLTSSQEDGPLEAKVLLPSAEQITVLAIEDNADTLQLWERYVQGTRFRLVGVREPERAFSTARELQPGLIVLDVMMPEIDGWELLGQLRHHPATSTIPIIVCTVLPQKELALSLGASDFLRKPVTRRSFRAVLACQSGVSAPG